MSAQRSPVEALLSRRVIACVGAGGVGKTTLAAAIGLGAAKRGRRVLVLTIDPAQRLADALGVGALGSEPQAIPRAAARRASACPRRASSHAMMLDMKRTFDELVTRFAPDAAARERILANRIYQHVSDALAGSAEYSAMEKVYEMSARPSSTWSCSTRRRRPTRSTSSRRPSACSGCSTAAWCSGCCIPR